MKSSRILCIAACFGNTWYFNSWREDMFCFGDFYSIRELKMPNIKYSKRMLTQASAVDMYLLIRAELHRKFEVVKSHLPAFNYVVPEHER